MTWVYWHDLEYIDMIWVYWHDLEYTDITYASSFQVKLATVMWKIAYSLYNIIISSFKLGYGIMFHYY